MIYRLKITEPQAIRIAKRLVLTTGISRHVWTRGTRAFIATDVPFNVGYPVEIASFILGEQFPTECRLLSRSPAGNHQYT